MFTALGHFSLFVGGVAARLVTPPWNTRDVWPHAWTVMIRCVGPVLATTFPLGLVIGLQGLTIFNLFGAQRMLPGLVCAAVLRELSPLLASMLVSAQAGSSFAAELGAMRIKEELDATEVMAVDAIRWHVAPRVIAVILACPVLHVLGTVAGIFGGYVMMVWMQGEPSGLYTANLWSLVHGKDLVGGILKTVLFGATIGLVACYHGFYCEGGAAGVGRSVNVTVVQAVLAMFALNYLLTSLLIAL